MQTDKATKSFNSVSFKVVSSFCDNCNFLLIGDECEGASQTLFDLAMCVKCEHLLGSNKCDKCQTKLTEEEKREFVCHYCDRAFCLDCHEKSDYTMYHCSECKDTYCYYFGQREEYSCEKRGAYPCKCEAP